MVLHTPQGFALSGKRRTKRGWEGWGDERERAFFKKKVHLGTGSGRESPNQLQADRCKRVSELRMSNTCRSGVARERWVGGVHPDNTIFSP